MVAISTPAWRSVNRTVPSRSYVRPVRATTSETTLSRVKLGVSDLEVTEVCLGCMMFGSQNSEKESHEILSAAFDRGINFVDTAESYPVPPKAETVERSSLYLGSWIKKSDVKRDDLIIATKVAGFGPAARSGFIGAARVQPHSEPIDLRLDAKSIEAATDAELRRLGVDYIDLMQTHWPDRSVTIFVVYSY